MLSHANKEDGHIRCVYQADERADHVADSIALGDDEAVERTDSAKGCVEVTGLGDGVSSY